MRALICCAAIGLALVLSPPRTAASVVKAITFDAVVSTADVIFVGEVVDVESRWVETPSGRAIVTNVTFRVEQTLKGEARRQHTLEFLGGRVGDVTLEVHGVPTFSRGDRDVICARTAQPSVSPVVGMAQGRFRVHEDPTTGESFVTTYDGHAVGDVREIGQPRQVVSAVPVKTLTLKQLTDAIVKTAAGGGR